MFTLDRYNYVDADYHECRSLIVYVFVFTDGTADPYFYIGVCKTGTPSLITALCQLRKRHTPRNQTEAAVYAIGKVPKTYFIRVLTYDGAKELKQEILDLYVSDEKCLNLTDLERPDRRWAGKRAEPKKAEVEKPAPKTAAERKEQCRAFNMLLTQKAARPVRVSTHWYPSIVSAARDNNCSSQVARRRIESEEFPDWQFAEPHKFSYK